MKKLDGGNRKFLSVDIKVPWYIKLAGKIVVSWLGKQETTSYQCSGEKNWDYADGSVDVQVPRPQIIHWIKFETGNLKRKRRNKSKVSNGEGNLIGTCAIESTEILSA